MVLHSLAILTLLLCNSFIISTRIQFTLKRNEENICFYEELNSFTSITRLLFRYNIIEPLSDDFIDVAIISPTGKTIDTWNISQTNYTSLSVRESGLYNLCFSYSNGKSSYTSSQMNIFYMLDFITTGSRIMQAYPQSMYTINKNNPDKEMHDGGIILKRSNRTESTNNYNYDTLESMGFAEFDIQDVSSSTINDNTRVMVIMSTEYVSHKDSLIVIASVPKNYQKKSRTWNSMKQYISEIPSYAISHAETELGEHLMFDVTDQVEEALKAKEKAILFSLSTEEDGHQANLFGISDTIFENWPSLVFEDLGVDVMQEIAYFKENVFVLRGEISSILQRERLSRAAAESANSRINWLSSLINIVLSCVAVLQVFYVRKLLETPY